MVLFFTIVAAIVVGFLVLSFLEYVLIGLAILVGIVIVGCVWLVLFFFVSELGVRDDGAAALLALAPIVLAGVFIHWRVTR